MTQHNLAVYALAFLMIAIAFVGTAAPQQTTSADITITVNDSSNGANTTTLPITINSSSTDQPAAPPTNPTQRVLQITDKQQTNQLAQGDVSTVITIYNRDSTQNGVDVNQGDVSTIITLFNRN